MIYLVMVFGFASSLGIFIFALLWNDAKFRREFIDWYRGGRKYPKKTGIVRLILTRLAMIWNVILGRPVLFRADLIGPVSVRPHSCVVECSIK